MPKPAEILLERIDQRLAVMGKSRYWLSLQISDQKQSGIFKDIARRGSMPGSDRLRRIAEELGTTTDWLLNKADTAEQPVSEVSVREAPAPWTSAGGDGIRLLGTAYCDDLAVEGEDGQAFRVERVMLEADHVVRWVARPPALWAARDAYAIYYHGSSMEPRHRQGDVGIVDPRRPPSPGDDVVVQLNDGNGGRDVITVLVKELVRATSTYVELRQFNPEMTFRVPRRQVVRLHRIVPLGELLGA